MASKATPGTRRPAKTAYVPQRSNQRSADSRPVLPTKTSTGVRPRARETPKQTAAARTWPKSESIQPQKTPKARPLANVIRNDGTGAASACKTIRQHEATGAQTPNEVM